MTWAEFEALRDRWQEQQRREDYRAVVAAGFVYKSENETYTTGELFPSLASPIEQTEEAGIEAFKALFGHPGTDNGGSNQGAGGAEEEVSDSSSEG